MVRRPSLSSVRARRGFSLVELLTVVVILGVLAVVAVPAFVGQRDAADDGAAQADVSAVYKQARMYYTLNDESFGDGTALRSYLSAQVPDVTIAATTDGGTPSGSQVGVWADEQAVYVAANGASGVQSIRADSSAFTRSWAGGGGGGGGAPAPEIIGTFSTAFHSNVGSGASGAIYVAHVQSDQKILIGGAFTTWAGTTVNRIVRLNADGSKDNGFSTGTGTNSEGPFAIATQGDGKVIVGGAFTTWNGTSVNNIVRLNSDGTRDSSFTPGAGPNNWVRSIAVQSDGRIIVAGTFTSWSGTASGRLVRLNSDGTRDGSFTVGTGANDGIYGLVLQPDGKIIATGTFTSWNGTTANGIVRLNSDGTRDTSFATGTAADDAIWAVALQSDGKVVVGGGFLNWDGSAAKHIVRLNSDGTRDVAFTTDGGPNDSINGQIAIQPDGKIVVGGIFTKWGGVTVNYIVRLNTDGSRDTSFTSNAGTGANNTVGVVAIQGAALILAGNFTTWNGTTVGRIARLT